MEQTARSKQYYIRMSHRKLRRVANEIRGKRAVDAIHMLRFMPYFAANVIYKHLNTAIYNALCKYGEDVATPGNLVVSTIMVDEGPALKRFKPRAQGRIYRIEKPTAHLMVEVAVRPPKSKSSKQPQAS
jgi:large subunit ribosomal protein L22